MSKPIVVNVGYEFGKGTIEFFVPGLPAAKGYGFSKSGVQYAKANSKRWENTVALAAVAAAGAGYKPHEGFVMLAFEFLFPIASKRKDVEPGDLHGQDPDVTNLVKSTEDALKRILFIDDNRVQLSGAWKRWCKAGQEGVHIQVTLL